jgi:hypothetical protein
VYLVARLPYLLAPGQPERTAARRKCVSKSVAFLNYVTVSEPPVANRKRLSDNTPSRRLMNPAAVNLLGLSLRPPDW